MLERAKLRGLLYVELVLNVDLKHDTRTIVASQQ